MKNILNKKPDYNLSGRPLAATKFVSDIDIAGKEVLDIGCGFGWCELNFLKRGVKRIAALETSEDNLKIIRQNIIDERLTLKVGNAINLPFNNESFDTIVAFEVIEHIPSKTESDMFKEVSRVLRPGGHFYLSTPNKSLFSNISDPAWWLIGHRHYSSQEMIALGEKADFTVENIHIKGGWWTLLNYLNLYFSKWILRRDVLYSDFFVSKENKEYEVVYLKGFINLFIKFRKKE